MIADHCLAVQPKSNEFITIGAERAAAKNNQKGCTLRSAARNAGEELLLWQRLRCIYGTQNRRLGDAAAMQ